MKTINSALGPTPAVWSPIQSGTKLGSDRELSPILGDGLMDQAAAISD